MKNQYCAIYLCRASHFFLFQTCVDAQVNVDLKRRQIGRVTWLCDSNSHSRPILHTKTRVLYVCNMCKSTACFKRYYTYLSFKNFLEFRNLYHGKLRMNGHLADKAILKLHFLVQKFKFYISRSGNFKRWENLVKIFRFLTTVQNNKTLISPQNSTWIPLLTKVFLETYVGALVKLYLPNFSHKKQNYLWKM